MHVVRSIPAQTPRARRLPLPPSRQRAASAWLLAAALSACASCVTGAASAAEAPRGASTTRAAVRPWWTAYGGDALDALVRRAEYHVRGPPAPIAVPLPDLIELLHDIAADADFEGRAVNRSVRIETPERFVAEVDGELLYRAFENVIRNAVKHTAEGSTVQVRANVCPGDEQLEVLVTDHGPGVPPDMLEAIFEPFVRIDQRETSRGVGLGLAIARSAVLAHGGTINASLADNGGLRIRIALPR